MPKLKQPNSLEDLAIETLGSYVMRISQNAISALYSGRTSVINVTALQEFLRSDVPPIQSRKITVHMYSVIRRALDNVTIFERTLHNSGHMNVKNIMKSIVLGSMCPQAIILDMSILPRYAKKILSVNIYRFRKLNTLIVTPDLSDDSIELLPIGLSSLKCLVKFQMKLQCTDAIINALCSETIEQIHVSGSKYVTNASFGILTRFHKLTNLSISDTSMTAEGFDYVQSIQEYEEFDDTGTGFLHLSVGSSTWVISSNQLNQIAIKCPKLKHLEIEILHGDMNALINLTELEELKIGMCNFHTCNLDGFLQLRGNNLTSLKLTTIDQIKLTSIMSQCINLKELTLFKCKIMDIDLEHIETDAKIFQNLEIFDIDLRFVFSIDWLEHILYTCINIKQLRLSADKDCEPNITDGFVLRLLSKNPLQNLTKFSISFSFLSMISVNALIDQCPLLETLEELRFWCGVTDAEVKILRQEIKDKNQDLKINLYEDD